MKKKLLVFAFMLVSGIASAQFTIWEDDFEDSDVSDWTLLDRDGDAVNWLARTNLQVDENYAVIEGTNKILGTYNINTETLESLGRTQNNWAIAPAVDLSFYSGGMQLIINAQKAIFDVTNNLYVYASVTDAAPDSFTQIATIEIKREDMLASEFKDFTVDISQFAGKSQVYFALVTAPDLAIGYEIDKISITAASLGLEDIQGKKATVVKQNPVKNYLQLQLSEALNAEDLAVKIYNTAGTLVKDTKYNDSGILLDNLSSGVYYLVIEDGERVEKIKFIKE
ncbi:T9SS C-terminal target domain-containing protein [Flavobacterium cupreum]|uniref:T9SS C-terminal target domain-containing protein n=1 Tax=Flavobacterium cupreum TaxID=2133766 RepID=A0A434AD13_9FLAO|nr:T9SS type A sorting domain-containing protein [Flavobacterium cupreum]RUT72236.1 T9SS C-terminal target domain-containing protein [Flavobacterium cupreum]